MCMLVNARNIFVGKHIIKGPLRRSRCLWENNIKIDLKEIIYEWLHLIQLAQDRIQVRALVNVIMNLRVPEQE